MAHKASNSRKKGRVAKGDSDSFYTSLAEWEAENFPNLIKQEAREKLEKDPKALGIAIADDIFEKVGAEFLRNP